MPGNSPTPKSRALGNALRECREEQGIDQRTLAAEVGIHYTVLSRYETGQRTPKTETVATILGHLKVAGERRDAIVDLARGADEPLWLAVTLPEQQQQLEALLDFERSARTITSVSPLLVPGLLQTTSYIRAIMTAAVLKREVETRTAVRIGRREAITRPEPVSLVAWVGEGALRQIIGDRTVMLEQLRYLLDIAKRSNVDIRVMPYESGWHPALEGPFTLIDAVDTDPVVHMENRRSALFLHQPEDVEIYRDAVARVARIGMSPEDSSGLITKLITQLEEEST